MHLLRLHQRWTGLPGRLRADLRVRPCDVYFGARLPVQRPGRTQPNPTEFCGACFDPAQETLYVNQQGAPLAASPGVTYAICGAVVGNREPLVIEERKAKRVVPAGAIPSPAGNGASGVEVPGSGNKRTDYQ
jgi:hypothetical protein